MYKNQYVRLVGLRVDNLENKEEKQMSFFESDNKQDKLDIALDNIKRKYGYTSITRAGEMEIKSVIKDKYKKNKD